MTLSRRTARTSTTTLSSLVGVIVIGAMAAACGTDGPDRARATSDAAEANVACRFTVHVVDAADGTPLAGARVHAQIGWFEVQGVWFGVDHKEPEVVTLTDASGIARWEMEVRRRPGPAAGVTDDHGVFPFGPNVTYFAEADGHQTSTPQSFDRDRSRDEFVVRLPLKAAASVEGRVVDAETGAAVAGARVAARELLDMRNGGRDLQCGSTTTDAAGVYRITTLFPDARLALDATSDGYGPTVVEIRSSHALTASAATDLRLARPAVVEGTVQSGAGEPVAGARVVATCRSLEDLRGFYRGLPFPMVWTVDPAAETETLADGSFQLPGLSKGARYTVYVTAGTRPKSVPASDASIPAGDVQLCYVESNMFAVGEAVAGGARVEFVVARFPRVFVRLTDEAGVALKGPRDVVSRIDGQGPYGGFIDASGWAEVAPELGGLGLGRRRIEIEVTFYFPTSFDIELKPDDVVRRDVALHRR